MQADERHVSPGDRPASPGAADTDPNATLPPSRGEENTAVTKASAAPTGWTLGDYELLEEIARGGMGVVYRARHVTLHRVVALKMILSQRLASAESIRRFHIEARAVANLSHPGIIALYEIGEQDGQHYFTMELADGGSLHDRLRGGPLPPREAAELVAQVAEAVQYAHGHGIIHRDLKPQNVLLGRDGQLKVTDFGLAKDVDEDRGLTASGDLLGTPSYMAPEQAAGRIGGVGPTTDVYAIGAILYTTLVGRPPFQAASLSDTLRQVIEQDAVAPRLLSATIPRDLETICQKCLGKEPSRRYATAADLAAELRRYLAGEPIRARPAGRLERTVRWCRRKPLQASLIAAVLLQVVLAAAAGWWLQEARLARELGQLRTRFESVLDQPALSIDFLRTADLLADEIARREGKTADAARVRINDAFVSLYRQRLREQPRLSATDLTAFDTAATLLAARDGPLATDLRAELDRRRQLWQDEFTLRAPFENALTVFAAGTVCVDPQRGVTRAAPTLKPTELALIPAIIPSDEIVELQAVLDPTWDTASQIGLGLNVRGNEGYVFVLRPLRLAIAEAATPSPDAATDSVDLSQAAFRDVRMQAGTLQAEIRRNNVVMLRKELSATQVPAGLLRLRVERRQEALSFQINDLPALAFQDIFQLSAAARGTFGVVLPSGVFV